MELQPVVMLKRASTHNLFERAIDVIVSDIFQEDNKGELIVQLIKYVEVEKQLGSTKSVSFNKLASLLHALVGTLENQTPLPKKNNHTIWAVFEKIILHANSCLAALLVMTSPDMPKQIYLDYFIENVVLFVKYQLRNTIYQYFKEVNRSKSNENNQHSRYMLQLLDKLLQSIALLGELLDIQILTEHLVKQISSICVSCLHALNNKVTNLQLECLKLAVKVFNKYENYRKSLLDEILTSINNVSDVQRLYVIDEKLSIQMFTAYVLQLIQCSAIPANLIKEVNSIRFEANKKFVKLIHKNYNQTCALTGIFLSVFFTNGHKNVVFKSFVKDLLKIAGLGAWPAAYLCLKLLRNVLAKHICDNPVEMTLKVASLECIATIASHKKQTGKCDVEIDKLKKSLTKKLKKNVDKIPNILEQALLDFLAVTAQTNKEAEFSRQFYIVCWLDTRTTLQEASSSKGKKNPIENFLLKHLKPFNKTLCLSLDGEVYQFYINATEANLIAKHLLNKHLEEFFTQSLKTIYVGLQDTVVQVRTKALKCFIKIIQSDFSLLNGNQVKLAINHSLLDSSILMRDTALELIGNIILTKRDYIDEYYDVFAPRILDTGVSVRKRVIKLMYEICLKYPDFDKITQIYVSLIKRINDEESIQKLIVEVFQTLWFTPTEQELVLQKVTAILNVYRACKEVDLTFLESLLKELLKIDETKENTILVAYQQIVDVFVENLLKLEELSAGNSKMLYIFVKANPVVLVNHLNVLRTYLTFLIENYKTTDDALTINNIVKMMKLIIPLIAYPKQDFLYQLEDDLMKLIHRRERFIMRPCFSCLKVSITNFTHNYAIIKACFNKYYDHIVESQISLREPKQLVKRSILVLGCLLSYFDLTATDKLQVLTLFYRLMHGNDISLKVNAVKALGFICIKDPELMLQNELKSFYYQTLTSLEAPVTLKSAVLLNIEIYLYKEDKRLSKQSSKFNFQTDSLKEMKDVASGMASTIIQTFLNQILQSYINSNIEIRQPAIRIIELVLQQGLVQPFSIIPYLVCMSTDSDKSLSDSAINHLVDLEMRYPGCVHSKACLGIALSYSLQKILQNNSTVVRGFKIGAPEEYPYSINEGVFSILKNSKYRRGLILSLLKQFENSSHVSGDMLFLADNLASLTYSSMDELTFVVNNITTIVSLSGANVLKSFKDCLNKVEGDQEDPLNNTHDEDEDHASLLSRIPDDVSPLHICLLSADPLILLLLLKEHIKSTYDVTDSKLQQYERSMMKSPTKVVERTVSVKKRIIFEPTEIIKRLNKETQFSSVNDEKLDLIRRYYEFNKMMFAVDHNNSVDESFTKTPKKAPKRKSAVKSQKKKPKKKKKDSSDSDDESN